MKNYVAIFEPDLQVYKSAVQQGKDFAKEKDFLSYFSQVANRFVSNSF